MADEVETTGVFDMERKRFEPVAVRARALNLVFQECLHGGS